MSADRGAVEQRRHPVKIAVLALIFSLVAVSCGDDSGALTTAAPSSTTTTTTTTTTTSTTTTTTTTIPGVNTRYSSVFDLRERIESIGYMCTSWEVISSPTNALERAQCADVVLSIHTNASEAQMSVDNVAELMTSIEVMSVHLIGPNWSVNCSDDEDLCDQLQTVLGGEKQVADEPPADETTSTTEASGVDVVERARAQSILLTTIDDAGGEVIEAMMDILGPDQLAALDVMDLDELETYATAFAAVFHPDGEDVVPDYASDGGAVRALLAAIEACAGMGDGAPMAETLRRIFAVYDAPEVGIKEAEIRLGAGVVNAALTTLCPSVSPGPDELLQMFSDAFDEMLDSD